MLLKVLDMGLKRYSIGQLVEQTTETNEKELFGVNDVRGMTITKQIIPTKADTSNTDLRKYLVIHPNEFIYNPRTHGKHIGFGYNDIGESFIISWNNIGFRIKKEMQDVVLPTYLFLHFVRDEWDREACFRSWGSSTEVFSWNALCEMEVDLPSLTVQQKYVDIYKAMVANQQSYERGLEDLKLVCDGYIEDLRRKMPCEKIGDFIEQSKEKNTDGAITLEQGINIEKKFITPQRSNDNFFGRQIVRTGQIAYCTQLNNENVAVALRKGPDCIVSSVYDVIYIKDEKVLIPEYLMMWLSRKEFGRFVYWASQGTSYEFLSYENLAGYEIPVPKYEVQKSIVNIYNVYNQRKEINEQLKEQIKNICPILIKGSLEE